MSETRAPKPYSLTTQLLFWLLVPVFIASAIALIDAWYSARQTTNEILDRVLSGSVLAIAERVIVADNGDLEIDIPYVALEMLTSSAQDRVFYRVDRSDGTFVTGYNNLDITPDTATTEGNVRFGDSAFLGSDIRFASYSSSVSTGLESIGYTVTVAETTNARLGLAQSIFLRSLLRQAALVVIAPFVVWFAITRSLQPIYGLRDAIGRRSSEDLRPITRSVPIEMAGLLDATNTFISRLRLAIDTLRHFTGNASHQLRTPLAIIRTELTLLTRSETLLEAKAHAQIADQAVSKADRVLSQFLTLARIDEAASKTASVDATDLSDIARSVVSDHVREANRRGMDLGFEGDDNIACPGERVLLTEMIRNLVENAMNYAGGDAVINVRVRNEGRQAVLEVEDDGPGIADDMKEKVLERFDRGGIRDHTGSGLGLSVVREIVGLYTGTLELLDANNGGLLVRIKLPKPISPAID